MSKHTKAKRREAFQTNALCAYGWSMDPIIDYRESRPDWTPPTGPSVTMDLDALPTAEQPHVVDTMFPTVTIDHTHPQPAWVVLRNRSR